MTCASCSFLLLNQSHNMKILWNFLVAFYLVLSTAHSFTPSHSPPLSCWPPTCSHPNAYWVLSTDTMLRIALSPRSVLPRPQSILGSMASSMRRQYSAERGRLLLLALLSDILELPSNILRSTIYNPNHGEKHCVILHGLMGMWSSSACKRANEISFPVFFS